MRSSYFSVKNEFGKFVNAIKEGSKGGKAQPKEAKSKGGKRSATRRRNAAVAKKTAEKMNKIFINSVNQLASDVIYDVAEHYTTLVSEFYDHYNPKMYDRTGNLYNAYEKIHEFDKNTLKVGIRVGSDFLPPNCYSGIYGQPANTKEVFELFWHKGQHGNPITKFGYSPTRMDIPPKEAMREWFNNYEKPFVNKKIVKNIKENIKNISK